MNFPEVLGIKSVGNGLTVKEKEIATMQTADIGQEVAIKVSGMGGLCLV